MTYRMCPRCQKGYLFPTELHSYGQVSVSKPGVSAVNTPIKAHTCGACGYTEIYAADWIKLRPLDYPAISPGKTVSKVESRQAPDDPR